MDEVVFGRYRLTEVIGQGGMGTVYRAHDTEIDRDVAIKVLPAQLASEPGYEQRFRREAHTAARLTEPHIIPIYDTGEIDGQLYLVMPIIDGTDVDELLRREGPMSPQRAVRIIEQVASALEAAHAVGLVHRDIKPSNTLITGRDFAYLIDFGIAHDATATKLTNTGMIVGTMAYMAPERFTAGVADARSDVYALACVLHECLTGDRPFPGDSMEQQIAGHLSLDPPRASLIRPEVPAGFDDVIATGMAKKPDQRYQSAHDLAEAAHQALTAAPSPLDATRPAPKLRQPREQTLAAPPPPPPPPTPGDTPNRLLATEPDAADRSAPATDRNRRLAIAAAAVVAVVVVAAIGISLSTDNPATAPTASITTATSLVAASPVTTTPTGPAPVAESALQGLLLSADEVNAAMGATGMATVGPKYPTGLYGGESISDKNCAPLYGPVEADAYAGSGYSAVYVQQVKPPGSDYPAVLQAVVLFPAAQGASAFFGVSAQGWPACSNRQFTFVNSDNYHQLWSVGPISNAGGVLSVENNLNPYTTGNTRHSGRCERSLTAANNVVIDVRVCSGSPTGKAVDIAQEIAAKVPMT